MKFSHRVGRQLRQPNGFFGWVVGKLMNVLNKEMYSQANVLLELKKGEDVLEIGFGNGAFISEMATIIHPGKFYGADISTTMIAAATRKNRVLIKEKQVSIFRANAVKLPLSNDSVHKVVTINTIYFWENPAQVMAEVKRVLKPGGKFIVALNTAEAMQKSNYVQDVFTLYDKEKVTQLFQESGFTLERTTYKKMKVEDVLCVEGILPKSK